MAAVDLRYIRSLTDFLRNHKEHVERLRATETPEVLTINGKPELIVQSAEAYQAMLDRLEHAENVAGLIAARRQVKDGDVKDAGQAFDELRSRRGL